MKKFNIVFLLLKKKIIIPLIIFLQVFIVMSIILPYYNRYSQMSSTYENLKTKPIHNSIFYMGHVTYNFRNGEKGDNSITNYDFVEENKKKIYEYYEDNLNLFTSISAGKISYYQVSEDFEVNTLLMYDKCTLESFVEKHNNVDFSNYNNDDEIPVIVQDEFKSKYPLGSIVEFNDDENEISANLLIIGYYTSDSYTSITQIYSNNPFPITSILQNADSENVEFISLYNPNLEKYKKFDKFDANDSVILFLKDGVTKNDLMDFEKYIEKNSLGYYQYSNDLFEKQKNVNNNLFQTKFDLLISFLVVIIFSFISIGYINKYLLKERFKVFYLNGASYKDLSLITFLYYFIIYISSLCLYQSFFYILNSKYIKISNIFIYRLIIDDNVFHLKEFIFSTIFLSLIIIVITKFTIESFKIDKKRGEE